MVAVLVALLGAGSTACSVGGDTANRTGPGPVAPVVEEPAGPRLVLEDRLVGDVDQLGVTGAGFAPRSDLVVAQCSAAATVGAAMIDLCDVPDATPATTDASGGFDTTLTVRSVIGFGTRHEAVCPSSTCLIGAADVDDMTLLSLSELRWAADTAVPDAPQLDVAVLDWDADANTGTAVVTGRGYAPGSRVRLVQCPVAAAGDGVDAGDCLYDTGGSATAGSDGAVRVEMTAFPRFQRSTGELIDCVARADVCVLADPWPQDNLNRISLTTLEAATPG